MRDCGPDGTFDCCAATLVPGGAFNRKGLASSTSADFVDYPATVSDFELDVLQVTVGRFRAFVDAYPGSRPAVGVGAHPRVPASGWPAAWDALMPATQDDLRQKFVCAAGIGPSTWTEQPGPNERDVANCIPPIVLAAFCYWDGGRLPTLSDWQYAAFGGNEQRPFPWGTEAPDPTRTGVGETGAQILAGARPLGAAKWGHRDMLGGIVDLLYDRMTGDVTTELPVPCDDCATTARNPMWPDGYDQRVTAGVAYTSPVPGNAFAIHPVSVTIPGLVLGSGALGVRCARNP
jgi:formylglycine-generating enzyme required for sulfatase activity